MEPYVPSDENWRRVLAGELPDPFDTITKEDLWKVVATRTCPRDGRTLSDRDNPRIPGLNRELYCSCGFAITT